MSSGTSTNFITITGPVVGSTFQLNSSVFDDKAVYLYLDSGTESAGLRFDRDKLIAAFEKALNVTVIDGKMPLVGADKLSDIAGVRRVKVTGYGAFYEDTTGLGGTLAREAARRHFVANPLPVKTAEELAVEKLLVELRKVDYLSNAAAAEALVAAGVRA